MPFGPTRRASRAVTQLYDLVLSPSGLRATQFIILYSIGQEGEIAQCRLAEHHAVSTETLSRRLASLRRKGLLQVREGAVHHQQLYSLTPSGRERLNGAIPAWNRAQDRLNAAIGTADRDLLLNLCDRIVAGARQAQLLRLPNRAQAAPPAGGAAAMPAGPATARAAS